MTSTTIASPRAVADVSPRARFDAHVDVARANEHKVHHRWREVMRARRRAETRDAIVREARAHDDVLDERERALEALDANVDEGERAHRREAEAQGRRLAEAETRGEETRRRVEARAVKALATMREGFEDEDRKVSEEWGREVRETLGRAEEARAAFERERDDARATFEDRREEIRNQHGEDVSTMKMMYEHKIEELERELARVTAPSVRRGDLGAADVGEDWTEPLDDARAYDVVRAADEADAKRMAKITRDIKRLQSGVDHWRTKTETRSKEWEASHASRIAERAELVRRYESAKSGVRALRDARATALRNMCVSNETAIKQLTETLEHARRALHAERLDAKLRQRLVAEDAAEDDLDERFSDSGTDSDADRANEPLDYASRVLGRYYAAKTRRRRRM